MIRLIGKFVAGVKNDVGSDLLGGIKNMYVDSLACVIVKRG